jgi:hypothetical protein
MEEDLQRSPHPQRALLIGLAVLLVVLLLLWLASTARPVGPEIAVSIMPPRSGTSYDSQCVAFVTNATSSTIRLRLWGSESVEWEVDGVVHMGGKKLWGGTNIFSATNDYCFLKSGDVVPLAFEFPKRSTRFKIRFGYTRDAGPLKKMARPFIRKLVIQQYIHVILYDPTKPKPSPLIVDGWWDGRVYRDYESEWQANR